MTGLPVWDTVCATGHRPQHLSRPEIRWVRAELPRVVAKLRDQYGMATGVSGMAIGTDLWWAAALVDAGVNLWAHVPFPQQPDPWARFPEAQSEWRRLLDLAVKVTYYGDRYAVHLLHERNDGVLKASSAVVAVHKPSKTDGGTAGAVVKARRLGRPIVHLDPERQFTTLRQSFDLPVLTGAVSTTEGETQDG